MKRWLAIEDLVEELNGSVVTLGNFDGMHLGHQAIVRETIQRSKKLKLPSVLITFDPHPAKVLGYEPPPLLTTPPQRGDLLEGTGLDHFVIWPFTRETAAMRAREFVERCLWKRLMMKHLCIGPTTHVGRAREGTPEKLAEYARSLGFGLTVVPAVRAGRSVISSSRVREIIQRGKVGEMPKSLGRFYETTGRVVRGDGRGRGMGFPTANLGPVETLLPANGVYATIIRLGEKRFAAATNIGTRPTVSVDGSVIVESHLLDLDSDVTGRELRIEWLSRLRAEKRFPSLGHLQRQVTRDCEASREVTKGFLSKGGTKRSLLRAEMAK